MPQQRLRRHHDQRLARFVFHLPAQRVEVLGGRRRIDHLHVAFGAQREEPFQPRARVLRSLTLVSVRQQQNESAVLPPLFFGARNELIDDDLRAVDEVAELRLPHHESAGIGDRVSVLESEDAVLGEEGVVGAESALIFASTLSGMYGAPLT
jgi:hypothetical protein